MTHWTPEELADMERFDAEVESTDKPNISLKMDSKLYKTPFIEDWRGCKIQLFVESVKAFGDIVEAIRIRPYIPTVKTDTVPNCADCGGKIEGFEKYNAAQIANRNQKKYGKPICIACAKNRAEKEKAAKIPDPLAGDNAAVGTGDAGNDDIPTDTGTGDVPDEPEQDGDMI